MSSNSVGENISDEGGLTVQAKTVIPEDGLAYTGVGFEWGFSDEMQARPPFGGANHFSAGTSDGTEATYLAADGNVRIVHVAADGTRADASYVNRAGFLAAGARQLIALSEGVAQDYAEQVRTGDHWGAWPQEFVDFQFATGLSSYWYSSGSGFDPKKAPNAFLVDFSAAEIGTPEQPAEELAPSVTRQPSSSRVEVGKPATFTATASGDPLPTIQWQQRAAAAPAPEGADVAAAPAYWADIEGATAETYTIDEVTPSMNGLQLRAVFSNDVGDPVVTEAVTLTVVDPSNSGGGGNEGTSTSGGTGDNSGTGNAGGTGNNSGGSDSAAGADSAAASADNADGRSGAGQGLSSTGSDAAGIALTVVLLLAAGGAVMLLRSRRTQVGDRSDTAA